MMGKIVTTNEMKSFYDAITFPKFALPGSQQRVGLALFFLVDPIAEPP